MTKRKARQLLIHVTGCIISITLPILFMPGPKDLHQLFHDIRTLADLTAYLLLIVFFYINYDVLVPRLYFNNRLRAFVLIVIGCYLLIVFLPGLIIPLGPQPGDPPPRALIPDPVYKLGRNLFLFLGVLFFSLMMRINERLRRTEGEKLNAEVSYLKAQINPHFLFNTLNSIYSLAIEKSDKTPQAVVKLSEMMRYVVSETHHEFVSLEKELAYINNYIELQKIRFDKTVQLLFEMKGDPFSKRIAPLLLIPFVENAFKYGVNPEEESDISIVISIEGNKLLMSVRNRKVNNKQALMYSEGVGIENVKNRLTLMYPSRHELTITGNDNEFHVLLTLTLA